MIQGSHAALVAYVQAMVTGNDWHPGCGEAFLPDTMCFLIPEDSVEVRRQLVVDGTIAKHHEHLYLSVPNEKFVEWAKENDVDFKITRIFSDGCKVAFADERSAVLTRLSWDKISF